MAVTNHSTAEDERKMVDLRSAVTRLNIEKRWFHWTKKTRQYAGMKEAQAASDARAAAAAAGGGARGGAMGGAGAGGASASSAEGPLQVPQKSPTLSKRALIWKIALLRGRTNRHVVQEEMLECSSAAFCQGVV